MTKLNVKALALGLGISFGIYMLFLGLVSMFGWGIEIVNTLSSFYIGFEPSVLGAIIGAIWGFFDGLVGGAIIAFVYNYFEGKKWISFL